MATSLLAGAGAVGQSTPAGTSWQKFPAAGVTPPAPSAVPPPAMPAASPPGSRVVLFTKPAGDVKPVQATDPKKPADEPKPADKDKPLDVKPAVQAANPFLLRTDGELAADIDVLRDLPAKMKDYEEKLKDPLQKPSKPILVKDYLLPVTQFQPPTVVKPGYAPTQAVLEPSYVVHRRLFFEEKNSDRYGWEMGFAQPFLSAGYFFKDVLFWPAHLTSNFFERYDTSAGKCRPGDPVAYYLYPPNITLKGGLFEAGVVIGTAFLLP
jgi:hypothetical protein